VEVRQHHREVHGLGSGGNARGSFTPDSRPRVRERKAAGPRRIEDVTGAPVPAEAAPAADGAEEAPDPAPRPAPSRPVINAPSITISPESRALSVSEAVRDALPLPLLADLIRTLSVAVSEADGAGEAGYLSTIQSTQVAVLLYDSTVDLVVTRFKGDVSRFKAGLAVVVILASKGSVHGRAIRDKARNRMAERAAEAVIEATTEDDALTPLERAYALQRRQSTIPEGIN
jgi:hypothetical protein